MEPLTEVALARALPLSDAVGRRIAQIRAQGARPALAAPLLHPLANDLVDPDPVGIDGEPDHAILAIESARISAAGRERASRYRHIFSVCRWNEQLLRAAGIDNVSCAWQGIDPVLFHPAPRSGLFADRFVVFSGGKLEYRKGQDLAVAAFKAFAARHPEALLVTSWGSPWPHLSQTMARSAWVRPPALLPDGRFDAAAWLESEGLSPGSFVVLPPLPNGRHASVLREADACLFTSRAEGGTNLVAMEALACGAPVILSANTGHLDLIADVPCLAARRQRPVAASHPEEATDGWGESDVEELVEHLELLWRDREGARAMGARAASAMAARWTWDATFAPLLARVLA
ncbi:MAG: glycosyltransferase [Alphaproteobacteria bacterium]|nr:glycosyltransferase [Alphaproteobacteria bacterium]